MAETVYATRDLIEVLLEFSADAEPNQVTADIAVTRAGDLEGDDAAALDPAIPVFTHFYHPRAGESISAVFGVDLSTPPGRTQGRFVSHPQGGLELERTDDLRETVLVAVPPWEPDQVAAFDRRGRERALDMLDATPPTEELR